MELDLIFDVSLVLRYDVLQLAATPSEVLLHGTLGGETVIFTLGGVSLLGSLPRWGVVFVLCDGRAPSNVSINRLSAIICPSPTWHNSPAGFGCNSACVNCLAA
jgi:hypothetical protein